MMARKNYLRSEASGSIHFDARTKTVMAEVSHENVKEKVQAVREVMPGKSNNEVVMVLQYYDYNVERAIQAYLEDGAKEALQEWNFTGSKSNKKRKNKKKGNGEKASEKSGPSTLSLLVSGKVEKVADVEGSDLPNGNIDQVTRESEIEPSLNTPHNQSSVPVESSTDTTQSALSASASLAGKGSMMVEPLPQRQPHSKGRGHGGSSQHHQSERQHTSRERTESEISTDSVLEDGSHRKPHQGLEKAIKDLHRQTTSFERLRHMLDHEIDRSYRSLKGVFEELRQGLTNREAKLLEEMSVLKREASEMLEMRQSKAGDLKKMVDRSDRLKDTEVSELRAEIKHFVSERRHDEEVGRTTRFLYDSDHMMEEIKKFGQVVHVKSMYTTCSTSALAEDSSSPEGSHNKDLSSSQELQEMQDQMINSLRLQNSPDKELSADLHPSSTQNGSSTNDFLHGKTSRKQQQFPRQSAQSGSEGAAKLEFGHSGVMINSATSSSSPGAQHDKSSDRKSSSHSSNQEPSLSHKSGSLGRGGYSNNTYGPRGRGRGRGGRGVPRSGGYSSERP